MINIEQIMNTHKQSINFIRRLEWCRRWKKHFDSLPTGVRHTYIPGGYWVRADVYTPDQDPQPFDELILDGETAVHPNLVMKCHFCGQAIAFLRGASGRFYAVTVRGDKFRGDYPIVSLSDFHHCPRGQANG